MFRVSLTIVIVFCFDFINGDRNFWFVSDFHVDQNYTKGGNPSKMCHKDDSVYPDTGLYGNFLCDSPMILVDETVQAMKNIYPNPDFIIWTGDSLPHFGQNDAYPQWDVVFKAINNITERLYSSFPNIPIYPSIGNHDSTPPDTFGPNTLYDGYLTEGGWNKLLSKQAITTFKQGGFYSEVIRPGLRLISLNTILYYSSNDASKEEVDPANQFSWLETVLSESRAKSEKVYIIGHISPGFLSRSEPGKKPIQSYHSHFAKKYLDIVHRYVDVIIGQMYGHYHLDYFQLYKFSTGSVKSSGIYVSSVTPWHPMDKYNVLLPINPSFKLMHYSDKDFSLLDFEQFFMNLSRVNSLKETPQESGHLYELLYKFTSFYGVPDLSTSSLTKVYENLKADDELFQEFFYFLSAGKKSVDCGKDCKRTQLCAMSSTIDEEFDQCVRLNQSVMSKITDSIKSFGDTLRTWFASLF